ncbi:MAG: hypothetical protein AAGG44_04160 [Planctomycetota bacterium]
MRKLVGTLAILFALLMAVGFVRGWFSFTTDSADNKTRLEVTVDKEKLKSDTQRIKDGVKDFSSSLDSGSNENVEQGQPTDGGSQPSQSILPPDLP